MKYSEFLETKIVKSIPTGHEPDKEINPMLFEFQKDITKWAIRLGCAAIFADCGLGKTPMQLEWASHVPGNVLIVAPLAVSQQTIREGQKFGIAVSQSQDGKLAGKITITNYERFEKFNMNDFTGVVLDESSILKSLSGKYRTMLIDRCRNVPYRLCCTATPAPNDHMELGNHAEFLGVMKRTEMLSMFFVNDMQTTQKWRLKGHAEKRFWEWMCSWAVMIRKPSDLGYDDNGFVLPEITYHEHIIKTNKPLPGEMFEFEARTLTDRRKARKDSIDERSDMTADLANQNNDHWLVWCNLNNEGDAATNKINGAVQVAGSDPMDKKENKMIGFTNGDFRVMVTKPKIAGFGMNWQHCHNMVFLGLSDSYEQMYQAVRRCWRFGQKNPVNVHIVITSKEGSVLKNIKRKERDAEKMANEMLNNMKDITKKQLHKKESKQDHYKTGVDRGDSWQMFLGDCVESIKTLPTNSIDYSMFSPPFAELYTYSDSSRDMGNAKNYDDFFSHFDFLTSELFRVVKSGRLISVHCVDIPAMKERDGFIGLKDFPGDIIRQFLKHGFIYHSRVVIWKDPLVEATRTKSLGLMHKQIQKDSAMCRQGLPDYVLTFRKPGDNSNPVDHPEGFLNWIGDPEKEPKQSGVKYSHHVWQKYASPVWMDINQTNTLQKKSAREDKDEKHICPLQLDTIGRCLHLWTNPGDMVLSPFAGIGSEGFEAVKMGRRFIGFELKESYYKQAIRNLKHAEQLKNSKTLFEMDEL